MKLCCFKHLFLLAIICLPFLFLDSSDAATRLKRNVLNNTVIGGGNEQVENGAVGEILSDESLPGRQEGDNVLLTGSGPINLTIPSGRTLQFQVCEHACKGKSWVCYESKNGFTGDHAAGSCSSISSTCEFLVNGEGDDGAVYFGKTPIFRHRIQGKCLPITMHYKLAEVLQHFDFKSCDPKIDPVEKMVKLHAYVVSSCPITVMNAKIHVPKVSTTLPPQTAPRTENPAPLPQGQAEAAADAGFPWWGYVIISAGCVLVLIVIGVIVYFACFKKQKSSNAHPPPETVVTAKPTKKVKVASPDVQPPTTITAAPPAAAAETKNTPSSTRKEDLNFTKFEPSKKSKKVQKKAKNETTTTQEPTEDAPPAPGSRQPVFDLSNAPEPVPLPYTKPHRLVPRSMKSAKTDSLEKTLPKEKKAMIEPVVDSVARHCLTSSESDVVQEMKSNYPEIKRDATEAETELLGLPVSQMFKRIDGLARESKRQLSAAGFKFDKNRCITFVPESARSILQDKKTAATTVYFAFGAEYHQQVKCDKLIFYSLPLLMVITLQKRFDTGVRRKACALIRRKMPIVLANNTEAARQKMAYPMNSIEKAYCKDPKPFRNLSEIKTDSESERRIKEMKEAAAAAEKKETVPGGGGCDLKPKKKSSKKRH